MAFVSISTSLFQEIQDHLTHTVAMIIIATTASPIRRARQ